MLRRNIASPGQGLLSLNDHLPLNAKMPGLKGLFDAGQLAIVNGVGDPNPDRSHFPSMQIWQTRTNVDVISESGWIGGYFDNCCPGKPQAIAGVNVGGEYPQGSRLYYTSIPGIRPGLHGTYPSLTDLDEGDLRRTVDFRVIYGVNLTSWFGVDHTKVLDRNFPSIGVTNT